MTPWQALVLGILLLGVRWMLRIVDIPKAALFPVVLVLCTIGAYALSNTMSNVYILLAFGLVGYAMVKSGFPLAPFILGVILGDQIEVNLIRAVMTDANPWLFLTRPISGGLLVASVASIVFAIWQHRRQRARPKRLDQARVLCEILTHRIDDPGIRVLCQPRQLPDHLRRELPRGLGRNLLSATEQPRQPSLRIPSQEL